MNRAEIGLSHRLGKWIDFMNASPLTQNLPASWTCHSSRYDVRFFVSQQSRFDLKVVLPSAAAMRAELADRKGTEAAAADKWSLRPSCGKSLPDVHLRAVPIRNGSSPGSESDAPAQGRTDRIRLPPGLQICTDRILARWCTQEVCFAEAVFQTSLQKSVH